ncbi:hypothetical protein B5807_03060 [Epicoccum nigrum]|uniref:Uncharacterized protein n=1 Tax=Epicoccum nigrum TaxID=105696 RepID=A0A1Y2M8H4_EPING|nr:hypothetical protein B5807_03060 [Epicoccum nigrum]
MGLFGLTRKSKKPVIINEYYTYNTPTYNTSATATAIVSAPVQPSYQAQARLPSSKDNASEVYSTPATEKIHEEDEDFERMIADITRTEEEIDRMIAEMEVEEAELEAIEKKFCEQQKGKKAEAAARAA